MATALTKFQDFVPAKEGRLALALDGAVCGWARGVKDHAGLEPTYRNFTTLAGERLRPLKMTAGPFTVDPGFDPKRYEAEAVGVVWEKPKTVVIRLSFSAGQAPYVREREWHPN